MSKTEEQSNIIKLGHEILFKIVLFTVAILAFIAITITLIYMALNKYEWELVAAIGGSDGMIGVVISIITKSLFKSK